MTGGGERYLAANGCHLRPGATRPGPSRCGGRYLPAGAARRGHRIRGPGGGGLPAGRARRCLGSTASSNADVSVCRTPRGSRVSGTSARCSRRLRHWPAGRARSLAGRSRCCPRAGPITDDDKAGTAFRGHGDPHPAGASQCVTLCNDGRGVVGDFARGDEPGDQRPGGGSGRRVFPDAHRRVEGPCVGDCTRGVRRIGAVQVAALPACLPQRLPRAFSMRGRCSAPTGSDRRSAFPAGPGSGVCARRPARRRGAAILGG